MTPTDGPVHGSIDTPDGSAPMRREAMVVKGWAVGRSSPVSFVDVWLDGYLLGRAGLGRPRPDVAEALDDQDAELSGFELRHALAPLDSLRDHAVLRARVTLLDGTRAHLPTVETRLARDPAAPEPCLPEAAVHRIDSRRLPPRERGDWLRILWFERALGRGGSQMRLKELIEHLAKTDGPRSTVIAASEGPLRRELEKFGAVVEVSGPFPLDDVVAYERRMSALVESAEGRFDLVVGHTLTSFPAIDLAERLGLPSIWRVGEAEALSTVVGWLQGHLDPAVEARARLAFATASVVVFNSNAALRAQQITGVTGRFVVLKTGVDVRGAEAYAATIGRDRCRRSLGIPSDRRLLICIGTLWPMKGQGLLAWALGQVRGAHRHLDCTFIGEPTDPYAGALARFVEKHGLSESVRVLPFLDDLRPWLCAADVAVCASETESMPASVLEAMSFGLPVLASRVGDVPQLVAPGVTRWLCEPSHLGSMVEGLEHVATTALDELRRLGSAAARKVRDNHDREVVLARTADLIREVTRGSNPDEE